MNDYVVLDVDDVFTLAEGITFTSSASRIVKRGKHIYADIEFTGSVTSTESGVLHILTIKNDNYKATINFSRGLWLI